MRKILLFIGLTATSLVLAGIAFAKTSLGPEGVDCGTGNNYIAGHCVPDFNCPNSGAPRIAQDYQGLIVKQYGCSGATCPEAQSCIDPTCPGNHQIYNRDGTCGECLVGYTPVLSVVAGVSFTQCVPIAEALKQQIDRLPIGSGYVPPVCGNAVLESGEQCDDGNTTAGDGCSTRCFTETPPPPCGNGRIDAGEQCDIVGGRPVSSDGTPLIASDCSGQILHGDGSYNPSCNPVTCQITGQCSVTRCDQGYTGNSGWTDCVESNPFCGDGFVASTEACDFGGTIRAGNVVSNDLVGQTGPTFTKTCTPAGGTAGGGTETLSCANNCTLNWASALCVPGGNSCNPFNKPTATGCVLSCHDGAWQPNYGEACDDLQGTQWTDVQAAGLWAICTPRYGVTDGGFKMGSCSNDCHNVTFTTAQNYCTPNPAAPNCATNYKRQFNTATSLFECVPDATVTWGIPTPLPSGALLLGTGTLQCSGLNKACVTAFNSTYDPILCDTQVSTGYAICGATTYDFNVGWNAPDMNQTTRTGNSQCANNAAPGFDSSLISRKGASCVAAFDVNSHAKNCSDPLAIGGALCQKPAETITKGQRTGFAWFSNYETGAKQCLVLANTLCDKAYNGDGAEIPCTTSTTTGARSIDGTVLCKPYGGPYTLTGGLFDFNNQTATNACRDYFGYVNNLTAAVAYFSDGLIVTSALPFTAFGSAVGCWHT